MHRTWTITGRGEGTTDRVRALLALWMSVLLTELAQQQVETARDNSDTQLPAGLRRPTSWPAAGTGR